MKIFNINKFEERNKIFITGLSCSGKTYLADKFKEKAAVDVMHLDDLVSDSMTKTWWFWVSMCWGVMVYRYRNRYKKDSKI